jgi:hypothetical protein
VSLTVAFVGLAVPLFVAVIFAVPVTDTAAVAIGLHHKQSAKIFQQATD